VSVSLTILLLTSSPTSKARRAYDKADLNTVKHKLDFGTSTTAEPAEAYEEITSLYLKMTLGIATNSPSSNIETPTPKNPSVARRQSNTNTIISNPVESTVRHFFYPQSSHLTIVCRKHFIQSRNASLNPSHSHIFKEALSF